MTRADLIIIGLWIGGLVFALAAINEGLELWERFTDWRDARRLDRFTRADDEEVARKEWLDAQ